MMRWQLVGYMGGVCGHLESLTRESSKDLTPCLEWYLLPRRVRVPVHKSRDEVATAPAICFLARQSRSRVAWSYSTAAPIITTGTTYRMTLTPGVACAAAPITEAVAIGDTLE